MLKFSIIIPIYNSEKYLARCLKSIHNQKYKNFEAIIIDDGSIDNSKRIVEDYKCVDSRVHYWREENSGPASARNLGIKVSNGDYICFIDSDDELLPNYFNEICNTLEKHKVDILHINAFYQNGNSTHLNIYQKINFNNTIMNGVAYLSKYLIECQYFDVVPWTKIIKRKFIISNNLFFEDIFAEDELWARECFLMASKVMMLNKYLYLQHRRGGSQSRKKSEIKNVEEQKKTFYELESLYKKNINNRKQLMILRNELSHNFIGVSLLNSHVRISYKDKFFALRNAKSLSTCLNALIFCISPKLRKVVKEMVIGK